MKTSVHISQWLGITALVVLIPQVAQSQTPNTVLYSTHFEATESYDLNKPLAGQNGWRSEGAGGNGLVTNFFAGQGLQAFLGFAPPPGNTNSSLYVWQPATYPPTNSPATNGIVQFSATMKIIASTNQHNDDFAWVAFNTEGKRLFAVDFYTQDKTIYYRLGLNDYASTHQSFSLDAQHQFQCTMNFGANQWSATLDTNQIVSNQPLIPQGLSPTLGDVDAVWFIADTNAPGNNYMLFDDYTVTLIPATTNLPPPITNTVTNLYVTHFEGTEGYDPNKPLAGQNGWLSEGAGGNGLVTNSFAGQGLQAYLGFSPPPGNTNFSLYVWHPVNYLPTNGPTPTGAVQFSVSMKVIASTNQHSDEFAWIAFNSEGKRLFTVDFDTIDKTVYYRLGTGDYVSTHQAFNFDTPYQLRCTMDFAANQWSATLDTNQLVTSQPLIAQGLAPTLGDVDAVWFIDNTNAPGNNYLVFDDYAVTLLSNITNQPPPSGGFRISGITRASPNNYTIRIAGAPTTAYTIEASENLTQWSALATKTTDNSGIVEFQDSPPTGVNQRFYRGRLGQ